MSSVSRRIFSVECFLALFFGVCCMWSGVRADVAAAEPGEKADAVQLGMGFRVGEVTQTSAIVWTRITKHKQRNWDGHREPKKRNPRQREYQPQAVKVEDREGAMPGAPGQVRVIYSTDRDFRRAQQTGWVRVLAQRDYIHQFWLGDLQPAAKYYVKVEARSVAAGGPRGQASAVVTGSFGTPAEKSRWQDVSFAVITGQSYWDLDHKQGFHIYPAMLKSGVDFLVPTGDTVYLDSESPRARTVPLARYHWQRMYSLPRHIEFHHQVPGYWEVDDHDTWCNDCWPTMRARWMNPLTFDQGFAIYREQVPLGDHLYRTVRWGKGLQVWMVEGRRYRSPNNMPNGPEKTIWGKQQLAWLKRTILESDAHFRVLISPTPIVGPDRDRGKNDNHSNDAFAFEGQHFRNWTKQKKLKNFYICNGDRHWQYMSIDPKTDLREFCCGPASDIHAGGNPPQDKSIQPFLRVKGGFLRVAVTRKENTPTIIFQHCDVHGKVMHEFTATSSE